MGQAWHPTANTGTSERRERMRSGGITFAACAAGSVAAYRRVHQLAVTRRSPPVTRGYSRRAA
eukprot:2791855-Prymnesium_polylepis.1